MSQLKGIIAAAVTPVDENGVPDFALYLKVVRHLLGHGCDGLNLLGTTGEATSFSLKQRTDIMDRISKAGLPMERLMVGTGAAAQADAIALTKYAASCGFAAALVLPPFYYKSVPDDGVVRYIAAIVKATASKPIPLYLYNFPALSGVKYGVGLIERLCDMFGSRIAGIKDSSGDVEYARSVAALCPDLSVFPSNEGAFLGDTFGAFAGCISATVNVNSELCARAAGGDQKAATKAVAIRKLFDGKHLVPSVKAVLAKALSIPSVANVLSPFVPLSESEGNELFQRYAEVIKHPPASAG